ncbi:MAG: YgiQ family radical SAM protein [Thermodesulfobacteriota bacterium]|nr:YgiQ family radical SAM protein [Thermodesulfobacteriota bacterium]
MFLPATPEEVHALGWEAVDVILVTGDAYIDAPSVGVAVIGRVLSDVGYRVGVIAQPDLSGDDIARLGEPALFWGVTGGCVDSMVSNYTATGKKRKSDDLTPGGVNNRRPDRAVIAYANLIRRHFKQTRPIVLGGIEASLRRISHYDCWSDSVRRSVLCDAKADFLVFGMGERTVVKLAHALKNNLPTTDIRGLCYMSREKPDTCVELPAHEAVTQDKELFAAMYAEFYRQSRTPRGKRLYQLQDTRYLVVNPPPQPLSTEELDHVYGLAYQRSVHPKDRAAGEVRAIETTQFSIVTHRGCFGECSFCAITVHEGPIIMSRSEASILREARQMRGHPDFKGIIYNVGGATANMYGAGCGRKKTGGVCAGRQCLWPEICDNLVVDHHRQRRLLEKIGKLAGVRHVFVQSGIRHDLVLHDVGGGQRYLEALLTRHISGQMKIAPEHSEPHVLRLMGKPGADVWTRFVREFNTTKKRLSKQVFFTCYFIAAFPGCTLADMRRLGAIVKKTLAFTPEQVQIFTPAPSTWATAMYHTEKDQNGNPVFVEKDPAKKEAQKRVLTEAAKGVPPVRPPDRRPSGPKKTRPRKGPANRPGSTRGR